MPAIALIVCINIFIITNGSGLKNEKLLGEIQDNHYTAVKRSNQLEQYSIEIRYFFILLGPPGAQSSVLLFPFLSFSSL